ncbi:hypothetical protein [Mycolicibacterium thermoresistibile]
MNPESANDVGGPGDTLRPMEALDSDDVRNDDGDEVVDPPRDWSAPLKSETGVGATDGETLDDKLAAERPDPATVNPPPARPAGDSTPDDQIEQLARDDHGTSTEQVSGAPEDGDSYFPVVE